MTLTERLQAQLAARAATDPRMRAILRRIQAGTASFSDTALYTRYLGEMLGGILADALPDAAPEEIAEAARVLLREAHADVTAQAAIVQEIQDRQLGASLAAKRPKYPAGRVEKVASSLADQTVPVETRQRRARNASANVVASYHDTFIKENARIRSDAGFSCKTVRLGTQCCPWCAKLTGSYPAGSEPRDLFRRHDNCTCTIIYETRRTRQTLRGQGKSWNVVEEVEREAPVRFSSDEAKALQEAEMGRYRGLTNASERGTIPISRNMSAAQQEPPDFDSYKIVDDPDAVEQMKKTISETLGIDEGMVDLTGIRNVEVLEPFVKRLQRIKADTGMQFPGIISLPKLGSSDLDVAGFNPFDHKLYLCSKYFNSKELLLAALKDWTSKDIFPKQAKSIAYLAEHEAAHIRIPDALLEGDEANRLFRKRKLTSRNDRDIYEYFADVVAIYRLSPNTTDSHILKAIEFLRKGGVII